MTVDTQKIRDYTEIIDSDIAYIMTCYTNNDTDSLNYKIAMCESIASTARKLKLELINYKKALLGVIKCPAEAEVETVPNETENK